MSYIMCFLAFFMLVRTYKFWTPMFERIYLLPLPTLFRNTINLNFGVMGIDQGMSLAECICGHAFDDARLCRREKPAMWCYLSTEVYVVFLRSTTSTSNEEHMSYHVSYCGILGKILANPACSELCICTSSPWLGESMLVGVPLNFAASSLWIFLPPCSAWPVDAKVMKNVWVVTLKNRLSTHLMPCVSPGLLIRILQLWVIIPHWDHGHHFIENCTQGLNLLPGQTTAWCKW